MAKSPSATQWVWGMGTCSSGKMEASGHYSHSELDNKSVALGEKFFVAVVFFLAICLNFAFTFGHLGAELSFHKMNHINSPGDR